MNSSTKCFVAFTAVVAFSLCGIAQADIIAGWTFETSIPTTAGPHASEVGTGTVLGVHASGSTTYSNPAGNGSAQSFSSNNWAAGDYYEFSVSTLGLENILFAWDQTGSNTGPRDFDLQYDSGSGFVTVSSYALTNDSWSSGSNNPVSTRSFDFSAISSLNNNVSAQFRLLATGTTAINGGGIGSGGSGRIDNVVIQGVPEPATAGFLLFFGVGIVGARRRGNK